MSDHREIMPPFRLPPITRRGRLKNGNPAGDPNTAPRCGAKLRGKDRACRAAAMANGRCRLHGGLSTGPRTPEGLERARRGNWKHGKRSRVLAEAKRIHKLLRKIPSLSCEQMLWLDGALALDAGNLSELLKIIWQLKVTGANVSPELAATVEELAQTIPSGPSQK